MTRINRMGWLRLTLWVSAYILLPPLLIKMAFSTKDYATILSLFFVFMVAVNAAGQKFIDINLAVLRLNYTRKQYIAIIQGTLDRFEQSCADKKMLKYNHSYKSLREYCKQRQIYFYQCFLACATTTAMIYLSIKLLEYSMPVLKHGPVTYMVSLIFFLGVLLFLGVFFMIGALYSLTVDDAVKQGGSYRNYKDLTDESDDSFTSAGWKKYFE